MKLSTSYWKIMILLLVLALVQSACNASSSNTQQPTSGPQGTQLPAAATAQFGTPEEAQAMLQKAVAHYDSAGRTQALSDFNQRVAPFFDRDLYVACIDSNLVISANGGFPNLVGKTTGPLSRAAWDAATKNKIDSINYAYTDPANGKTEPKTFYYEKVGSDVCGVGAYHP